MRIYTFLIAVILLCFACDTKPEKKAYKLSGNALGTTYHITYLGQEIDSVSSKIDSILFAVNHGLSTYQNNSLITAFNTNTNEIWNDPENAKHFLNDMQHFVEMVNLSKTISNQTNGAFDPSAAGLFSYYSKCKKEGVLMDESLTAEHLSHRGMDLIEMDPNGFPQKKDSLLSLNFNAIAKGYFVDLLADYISSKGCENYLVEVGGEMRLKGQNLEGGLWKVGVNVPLIEAAEDDYFKVLEVQNTAVATSGNYQNFYMVDGEVIGHTLDPRTGKPVISNLKSATVLHPYCAVADAWATASMVLGLEEARQIIEKDGDLSAYFIYEENNELKGVYVE